MKQPRKITKFQLCDRHAPWFAHATRHRKIECMVEGGPGGWSPGCEGGRCRLWPGTDLFEPSVCVDEMQLDWTRPAEPAIIGRRSEIEAGNLEPVDGTDGRILADATSRAILERRLREGDRTLVGHV